MFCFRTSLNKQGLHAKNTKSVDKKCKEPAFTNAEYFEGFFATFWQYVMWQDYILTTSFEVIVMISAFWLAQADEFIWYFSTHF